MKIELKHISLADLHGDYVNTNEDGVFGYGGKLNIRPPFQREFVYKDAQRNKVISSVKCKFPINVMYWSVNDNGTYEVMDGQQRTISICEYLEGNFSVDDFFFHSLTKQEQEDMKSYEILVYLCSGTEREKLDWFETINIAGEKLTDQELRNAVYTGPWLADAKRYFSKTGCVAYSIGEKYLVGSPIRQDYLETVLGWISGDEVVGYMSKHQHDPDAQELKDYFRKVIDWTKKTFPEYRKEMKGMEWGRLYNTYGKNSYLPAELERDIKALMQDDDVTNKKGIYEFLLGFREKERLLSIRAFDEKTKRKVFESQDGTCVHCRGKFELDQMQADHILPWSQGGRTSIENCQMLCRRCNATKSDS
jgi:hypothetical protein